MKPNLKFQISNLKSIGATLAVSLAAVAVYFIPGAAGLLEYDRLAIARGELWRLLTGHLTHFSLDHLFWDVATFAAVGAVCERRARRTFLLCLALSTASISFAVWAFLPEMTVYRGLSGIDSALFALLASLLLRDALAARRGPAALVLILLFIGFFAKTAFEQFTGATLFVANSSCLTPVPLAHLAGAAAGLAAAFHPSLIKHVKKSQGTAKMDRQSDLRFEF